jgi:hypothetical protein
MSTTNPDSPRDPVNQLAPTEPGAPAADDHDRSGPPDPAVIKRGYEEDNYDTRSVISVPIMVIVFFVLAFGTVTILFQFLAPTPDDPRAHPAVVERNDQSLPKRIAELPRRGRLEPMRIRTGNSHAITRPAVADGMAANENSREIHPDDIIPSPTNTPTLYKSEWLGTGKQFARITIDDAMAAAAKADLLKAAPDGTRPPASNKVPTAANAGVGFGYSKAVPPALPNPPKKADPKKDGKQDDKKDDKKDMKEGGKK